MPEVVQMALIITILLVIIGVWRSWHKILNVASWQRNILERLIELEKYEGSSARFHQQMEVARYVDECRAMVDGLRQNRTFYVGTPEGWMPDMPMRDNMFPDYVRDGIMPPNEVRYQQQEVVYNDPQAEGQRDPENVYKQEDKPNSVYTSVWGRHPDAINSRTFPHTASWCDEHPGQCGNQARDEDDGEDSL